MHLKKILFLVSFQIVVNELFSQKIIDSITVCKYPVRKGIIYEYDYRSPLRSICGRESGVTIETENDSIFHGGTGKVIAVHFYDETVAVIVKNDQNEFFCYSNLKESNVCPGDNVQHGNFIGLVGTNDNGSQKHINFMIYRKSKDLSFKKTAEYLRCDNSCEHFEDYNSF